MGNHAGCVSAPMDHGEGRRSNMVRPVPPRSQSTDSVSYSTSSVLEPLPLPTCDEEREYSFASHSEPDEESRAMKTNLKILFLDVDGVLNNPSTKWDEYHCGIDDELLKYLKFIVMRSGCKIVLSTTWRLSENAKAVLMHTLKTRADLNIDDLVIGQTPSLKKHGGHRTHEIAAYLRANEYRFNVVSWCAVDDLSLHKYDEFSRQFMRGHFVRTDKRIGITAENVMQCIAALNTNDAEYNPYSQIHRGSAYFAHSGH